MSADVQRFRWHEAIARSDLPGGVKLVGFAFSLFANSKTGRGIRPAISTVARFATTNERVVRRRLRQLIETEWLVPEFQSRGGRPSVYRLNIPNPVSTALVDPVSTAGVQDGQPGPIEPPTRADRTGNPVSTAGGTRSDPGRTRKASRRALPERWATWTPAESWTPEHLGYLRRHLAAFEADQDWATWDYRDATSAEAFRTLEAKGFPPTADVVEGAFDDVVVRAVEAKEEAWKREKTERRARPLHPKVKAAVERIVSEHRVEPDPDPWAA